MNEFNVSRIEFEKIFFEIMFATFFRFVFDRWRRNLLSGMTKKEKFVGIDEFVEIFDVGIVTRIDEFENIEWEFF